MAYPLARLWLLPLLRRRLRTVAGTEYLPSHKPYIAVANHSSWLDSAYIVAVLAKYTSKKIFILASSGKHQWLGGVRINRNNTQETLAILADKLKHKSPVIIFPEGNSNSEPTLRKGKTGAVRLALMSKAQVIPIGIKGTRHHSMYKAFWRFLGRGPIDLFIGSAIELNKYYEQTVNHQLLEDMTRDIMQAISKLSGKPRHND